MEEFIKLRGHYLPLTGRCNTQEVFDRLPVEELQAVHPRQWSLFILGFAYIKGTPIPFPGVVQPPLNVALSFMEIGAIHGKPFGEWPGDRRTPWEARADFSYNDKKDTNPFPSRYGGYCHHAAITFPSWHRPYVMLIEQAIGEYVENIAQQIENANPDEGGIWVAAAKRLRFPYWDWADPKVVTEGLPSLFYTEELEIRTTGKKDVKVPNPLVSFTFPYIPSDFGDHLRRGLTAYFSKWPRTYRYVDIPDPTESDIETLQATLKEKAPDARRDVGKLFLFPDGGNPGLVYDEFSNTRNESRRSGNFRNAGSLEGVHNSMHLTLGGNGHMGWPDYSAFDPIFYFHHCNVDRILALWDWCYPDYWMGNGFSIDGPEEKWTLERGTFTAVYNQKVEDTGEFGTLNPFRHPDGTYWTSKEARFFTPDAFPKWYSYKEFLGIKVDKAATSLRERRKARARIAKYYGVDPQRVASTIGPGYQKFFTVPDARDVELPPNFKPIKNFRGFEVLVRLSEHAIGTSYQFSLYYKDTLVGSVGVFAREDTSPCAACAIRREADTIVRGLITIPSDIIEDVIKSILARPNLSVILQSGKSLDDILSLDLEGFSGKLVDLSGKTISSAQGGTAAPPVPDKEAAPRALQPVEVSLLSAAVAEDADDAEQPVHIFDWKYHAELFPSGWKLGPRALAVSKH